MILIFFKSVITIDTEKKLLRKYTGIVFTKKGEWENINQPSCIQIVKSKESQTMAVLAISRTATNEIYKLYLNKPDKNILLMKGRNNDMFKKGKRIASSLHTSLISNTE